LPRRTARVAGAAGSSCSKPKALAEEAGGDLAATAPRAAFVGCPIGFGALLADDAGATVGALADFELFALAWKPFLQCLQRIGLDTHSAGMRSTFWQCGHLA
jgi:hypothetical protein